MNFYRKSLQELCVSILTTIPEEILREIFSYLTPETLCRLRQTSKRLEELARYYYCRNPQNVEEIFDNISNLLEQNTQKLNNSGESLPNLLNLQKQSLSNLSCYPGIWIGEEYIWRALKADSYNHAFEIALRIKTAQSSTQSVTGGVCQDRRSSILVCVLAKMVRDALKNTSDLVIPANTMSPIEAKSCGAVLQPEKNMSSFVTTEQCNEFEKPTWMEEIPSSGTDEDNDRPSNSSNLRASHSRNKASRSRRNTSNNMVPLAFKKETVFKKFKRANLPTLVNVLDAFELFPRAMYALVVQYILIFIESNQVSRELSNSSWWKSQSGLLQVTTNELICDLDTAGQLAKPELDLIRWILLQVSNKNFRCQDDDITILRVAAARGNLDVVRWLIEEEGIDVSCDRDMAVCEAAVNGHIEVVKYLHQKGANIHARWETCSRKSAANGHLSLLKWLKEVGGDVRALDDAALTAASTNGHLEVVKWLVEKNNANVHTKDDASLRGAAGNGHVQIVKYLRKCGSNIRSKNDDALCKAALSGDMALTMWLHQHGCNINSRENETLINACKAGNLELAQWLVSIGADIFADRGISFRSAASGGHIKLIKWLYDMGLNHKIHLDGAMKDASRSGHLHIVMWLCENAEAEIHADSDAPIRCAAVTGSLELVKWLHSSGADIRANSDHAIRRAAKLGHLNLLRWLYKQGGDIRVKDDKPFRNAAKHGHIDVVQWLYSHGADLRAVDDLAVTLASKGGHLHVVQWLCSKGADPTAGGNRALWGAVAFGQLEVVKWLHSCGAQIGGNVNAMALRMAEGQARRDVLSWLRSQPEFRLVEIDHRSNSVVSIDTVRT
ncbi:hypothetical protein HK096_003711 [Nowakowskiella sp. JEL0078]|nr:hypothetical protein HK096_003711 [Nowakowskiella sp. JEL0078]